jgi:ADP-ribose pyrophosphatase YjhB (NUDIX family)
MVPAGDNRPRYVCANCSAIHYQNPKMVIGSIPVWERGGELQVLLCKRAIEPRRGFWTLPAGFMENNETTAEAAQRETEEEAGANIELGSLFTLLNVPLFGHAARPRLCAGRGKPRRPDVPGSGNSLG